MNCEDVNLMINHYLDNELDKEKEVYLFMHLSSCRECREEFKLQMRIQNEVRVNRKKISDNLENRILRSLEKKEKMLMKKHVLPIPASFGYVLAIIITIISIFSFYQILSLKSDLGSFRNRYERAMEVIEFQNNQMNLMMSNMPAVQITGNLRDL